MSLYTQFRTDENLERTGILLEYGKNSRKETIAIRIARAGGANQQYEKRLGALVKPYRRQLQTDTADPEVINGLMKQVYAETVVLGWENVEDEGGQPLAFSVANCIKLFTDLPDLFTDIQEQASKSALFRAEILESEAKN